MSEFDENNPLEDNGVYKEKYRLPKKFVQEIWLPALRSGKYQQGIGALLEGDYDYHEFINDGLEDAAQESLDECNSYCCLGVAAIACGMRKHLLLDESFVEDKAASEELLKEAKECGYPYELIMVGNDNGLLETLSKMNDEELKTFDEIADWIEQEVELYD